MSLVILDRVQWSHADLPTCITKHLWRFHSVEFTFDDNTMPDGTCTALEVLCGDLVSIKKLL